MCKRKKYECFININKIINPPFFFLYQYNYFDYPSTRSVVVHVNSVHKLRGCTCAWRRRALEEPLGHSGRRSNVIAATAPFERVSGGQCSKRDRCRGERWRWDQGRGWWRLSSWWCGTGTRRKAAQSASSR